MIVFATKEYPLLLRSVLHYRGMQKGNVTIARFPNGELHTTIKREVRGARCLIVGDITPPADRLLEVLLLAHTLTMHGAREVIFVAPYLAYARQDVLHERESIASEFIGRILKEAGVDRVITVDVHSLRLEGLFPMPLVSLSAEHLFVPLLEKTFMPTSVISPDAGSLSRAAMLASLLGIPDHIGQFTKMRTKRSVSFTAFAGEVGERVLLVDDMIDTGETLIGACKELKKRGVHEIVICVTHGLFTGDKWKQLWKLGVTRIYCTDTVPRAKKVAQGERRITILSVHQLIASYVAFLNKKK